MCLCEGTSICTSIGSAPKPWDASNLANAYAFLVDTDVAGEAGATFRRGREKEREREGDLGQVLILFAPVCSSYPAAAPSSEPEHLI